MVRPASSQHDRNEARDALDDLNRPELSRPDAPKVERIGLGYKGTFGGGVTMVVSRLRESRSELSGELVVTHAGLKNLSGGNLFRGRFNLDSPTTRRTLAGLLVQRAKADWLGYLELFSAKVLDLERKGTPVLRIGDMPPELMPPPVINPIIPGAGTTILFGPGGVGKSTIAAALAVMAFTGETLVPGWTVTNPCRPLILDYEDSPRTWNDRIAQLARAVNLPLPNIHYLNLQRPLVDEVERIAEICSEESIGLVIVDSAGLAMGASSEYSDAADGALKLFGALREFRLPALVIDHVAASELRTHGPSAKPYGSVYKWNAARTVWEVKREKDPSGDRSEVLLVHAKSNHGARRSPIGLEFAYGEGTLTIKPAAIEAPDLQANLRAVDRISRLLLDGPKTDVYIATELDLPESTVRQVVRRYSDRLHRPERGMVGLSLKGVDDDVL